MVWWGSHSSLRALHSSTLEALKAEVYITLKMLPVAGPRSLMISGLDWIYEVRYWLQKAYRPGTLLQMHHGVEMARGKPFLQKLITV